MSVNPNDEFEPYGHLCPACDGSGVDRAEYKRLYGREWDGHDDEGLPKCAPCKGSGFISHEPPDAEVDHIIEIRSFGYDAGL